MELEELREVMPPISGARVIEELEKRTVENLRDALGRRIKVGDILAYMGRKGSDMWHNYGVVREVLVDEEENTVKLRLVGIGDHHVQGLGYVPRKRAVVITKWFEAIIIDPWTVEVDHATDISLKWCVRDAFSRQLEDMIDPLEES